MKRKSNKIGYELVIVAAAVVFVLATGGAPAQKTVLVEFPDKNVSITAEAADTPYAREKGLMFVRSLPENAGMIFVFESLQELHFWMKNTYIPLDIIFVSENFTVVNVAENAQPCSYYCEIYSSAAPAKYAIETNAGFAKRNGIEVGDKIRISY